MAINLRMRTTISPRWWQPWTAGIAVGYMNGRTRQKSKTCTTEASAKKHSFERQLHRGVRTRGSVQKLVFFKIIWAHRSIFPISSPYACRGRTVLPFPTNSYHLFPVELVLKQCFFALASEIEGLCYTDSPVHI